MRTRLRRPLHALVVAGLSLLALGCAGVGQEPLPGAPAHHVAGGFRNVDPTYPRAGGWARFKFIVSRFWDSLLSPRSFETPRETPEGLAAGRVLRAGPDPTVTWIGHSTVLLRMDRLTILTDPNWSERASPLSWAGPRRLVPPGLPFEALPRVDVVLISHDHYDHLDLATVKRLALTTRLSCETSAPHTASALPLASNAILLPTPRAVRTGAPHAPPAT